MELLESEWVLRDVLQPRPDPESLTVTFLDTASEERNDDLNRINEIRENIEEIKSELRDDGPERVGEIKINYKLITESIMLNSRIDLTGEDVVPRIAAGRGMNEENWWLEDQHIEENLNFAKGAVRKRGLGKAMFYKAYAEDDELSTMIDLPSKGEVAVITGLGGGTGSGTFIDIAQELAEKMPTADITLFSVLPNHTEGLRENANTFAALSELERLSLEDEQLFKDRILMPLGPTGFDGKRGNRVESDQMLEEFDEAVVYLIASYYNNQGMEDIFDGSPKFAPFIIGIPQVLRYNIEAINEARESFQEILDEKQDALQAEADIYEEFEIFAERHFGGKEGGLRGEDESVLEDRLSTFESLLEFDLFDELEYESVKRFREIITDAAEESEDIGEQLDIIDGSLRAGIVNPEGQTTYVDNVDAHLAKVLKRELELLSQRKQMLEKKTAIENSRIQRTVEYLLGAENSGTSAGGTIRLLETQLEEIQEKHDRLTTDLKQTESELEGLREDQADEIEAEVKRWNREIEPYIDELEAIDLAAVEDDLDALKTALSGFRGSIKNADSEEEIENTNHAGVRDAIADLEDTLAPTDVNTGEIKREINESMSTLVDAKKAFLQLEDEESTLESIAPWKSSTEEAKEQARKTYRMSKNRLDDAGVFSVGPPGGQFTADLEYDLRDIERQVERRQGELRAQVIDELEESLESSINESDREDLERGLEQPEIDREQLRGIAERAFGREIEGTDELEAKRENLQERIENLESDIELYESSIDLFEAVSNRRRKFKEHESSFRDNLASLNENSGVPAATDSDEYVYIKNIQPEQVFQATGSDTLAETGLFDSQNERHRLRNNLEELASNTLDRKYTGLQRRKFSHNGGRYHGLRIRVAMLSRAVDHLDRDDLDLKSHYREAFDLEGSPTKQRYSAWNAEIGNEWDVSMNVFIDGVFLDNIRKVVQADGYQAGYDEWRNNDDVDIRIHHSYGLEEGFYTRRNDVLNVQNTEDVEFILQDENHVAESLLNDYHETVEFANEETAETQ